MKKLFEIDENEKRRILEMHEKATKNLYLNEQGTPSPTPPPAQPQNATGGQISGTDTIDKVKDAASLKMFYDWGGAGITDSGTINKTPNMAYRLGFGNIKTAEELQADPKAKAAIDKVYEDFKTIAKTYTISELCGTPLPKEGIDGKALAMAHNRAGDLGWCGAKKTNSDKNKPASPQDRARF